VAVAVAVAVVVAVPLPGSLIATIGDMSIADLSKAFEATLSNDCFSQGKAAKQCIQDSLVVGVNATSSTAAGVELGVEGALGADIEAEMTAALNAENYQTGTWRDQDIGRLMYGYTLITFLWTVQVAQSTAFLIMATAVATLYWSPTKDGEPSKWPVRP
jgi:hypothetical protein